MILLFLDHFFVRDNVVTISTDSQPSSIHLIDDVKLDFNMQVLDAIEKEEIGKMENGDDKLEVIRMDISPDEIHQELQIITETTDEIRRVNGGVVDLEINNNVSKTTIIQDGDNEEVIKKTRKFSTEIKVENLNMNLNMNHESSPDTTPSTPSDSSSPFSSPGTPNHTTTKTLTLTQNPISSTTANFLKQEQKHTEKNFVPNTSEIKFKTAVYEQPSSPGKDQKTTEKRMSQIEQIRQNFEKSAQMSSEVPAPQPRKSSIPLSINKTSPSKIPVFNSKSSNHKTSPTHSRTNGSAHKVNNHNGVNDKNNNDS